MGRRFSRRVLVPLRVNSWIRFLVAKVRHDLILEDFFLQFVQLFLQLFDFALHDRLKVSVIDDLFS